MTHEKSPGSGGNQGEGKEEKRIGMPLFYPSPGVPVNGKCSICVYFRAVGSAKRTRTVCMFTGEPVTAASADAACGFFILGGGPC